MGGGILLLALYSISRQATRRNFYFWTRAFPIYLHYKLLDFLLRDQPKAVRKQRFNELHDKYAAHMYNIIPTMGGFYLKLGQIGGTRHDFVPPQFTQLLQTLEDQVPSV